MESGATKTESGVFKASASLLPLGRVWEQACGFAEGSLDLFVKVTESAGVEVGGDHSHVVGHVANSSAVPQQSGGDLWVVDQGDLFQELDGFVHFALGVGLAKLFVPYAGPQDFKAPIEKDP